MLYNRILLLYIWLIPLQLMATISPETVLEKATNRTLTREDITAYVKSRAAHRVQSRRQQRQNIPRYAQQTHACTRISDILVTSVSVFTLQSINPRDPAVEAQCSSRKEIRCTLDMFINNPMPALLTIEHELTHAEQFAEHRTLGYGYESGTQPLNYDGVFTRSSTDPAEYEADFVAVQFHPFPRALRAELGFRYIIYRDTRKYASQPTLIHWLEARCRNATTPENHRSTCSTRPEEPRAPHTPHTNRHPDTNRAPHTNKPPYPRVFYTSITPPLMSPQKWLATISTGALLCMFGAYKFSHRRDILAKGIGMFTVLSYLFSSPRAPFNVHIHDNTIQIRVGFHA